MDHVPPENLFEPHDKSNLTWSPFRAVLNATTQPRWTINISSFLSASAKMPNKSRSIISCGKRPIAKGGFQIPPKGHLENQIRTTGHANGHHLASCTIRPN
jgi:hypothetical protein